jgi:hypothetical protein
MPAKPGWQVVLSDIPYLKGLRSGKEVVAFSMKFPGPPFLLA